MRMADDTASLIQLLSELEPAWQRDATALCHVLNLTSMDLSYNAIACVILTILRRAGEGRLMVRDGPA